VISNYSLEGIPLNPPKKRGIKPSFIRRGITPKNSKKQY